MNKKQRLNKLLTLTEKKFNRGSSKKWKNKDFEDLCFSIHLETKILVSAGTLKRVFGKIKTPKEYFPQEATVNALELYTGSSLFPAETDSKPQSKIKLLYVLPAILLVPILAYFIIDFPKHHEIPVGEMQLSKIDGTSPATVYFDYMHTPSNDSVFINWGDNSDPQYLQQAEGITSHYYRIPGKFKSNLETRENVISESVDFFVPTNGWQVLASYFGQEYEERYFPVPLEANCTNGVFNTSRRYISSLGMDTTRIIMLQLDNYKQTEVNGDSFTLETKITNSLFWPAIRCFSAFIIVDGEYGTVYFKFVNHGCSQFAEYIIGEKNRNNNSKDLSGFAVDMTNWNTIKIENTDKLVSVKANGIPVFDDTYTSSIGNIIGVSVKFHGIGSIDYFHLKDVEGQAVFSEEFE